MLIFVLYLDYLLRLDRKYGRSPLEVLQRHATLARDWGRTVLDRAVGASGCTGVGM
jgi:phage portal protein BeeE